MHFLIKYFELYKVMSVYKIFYNYLVIFKLCLLYYIIGIAYQDMNNKIVA